MNTQLDPDTFHRLLQDATDGGPVQPPVHEDLGAGRRRLRRRRIGTGALALAAVAAVGLGATVVLPGDSADVQVAGDPGSAAHPGTGPGASEADLISACRDGGLSPRAERALFGSGTPSVHGLTRDGDATDLALLSADQKVWGQCYLSSDPEAEFAASTVAYRADRATPDIQFADSGGVECGRRGTGAGCADQLSTRILLKLPTEVATVRLRLIDGRVVSADTDEQGFVSLSATADTPDQPFAGRPKQVQFLTVYDRIDYLDADGEIIAAQASNGTGSGPDGEVVDGHPTLETYPPSLAPVG